MPKDNEVDEKVEDFFERLYGMTFRLFLDPNSEEDEGNTVELRLGATVDNLALFETQDHAVLHTAATVAELRADRDSWREQAEDRLREWDKLRAEVERSKDALAAMSQFAKVAEQRADAAERRVGECLKFIDGIRDELHNRRTADWFPEGAHNAAEQMSEDMRLLGNACADFDPYALTGADPT